MKKVFLYTSCFVLLAITIILSCRKADTPARIDNDLAAIQSWFITEIRNNHAGDEQVLAASGQSRKILWDKAIYFKDGEDEVFQIPYKTKSAKTFSFTDGSSQPRIPLSLKEENSVRYLIITKRENGLTDFALMTVLPTKQYNTSVKGDLAGNNYRNLKKEFAGHVLFHDWKGTFKNGWVYNNGSVVEEVRDARWDKYDQHARTTSTCTTTTIYEVCQTCTEWTFSNGEYSYSNCTEPFVCGSTSSTTCTVDETAPNGGGGSGTYTSWYGVTDYATLCGSNVFAFKYIAGPNGAYVGNLTGFNSRFAKWGQGTANPTVIYVPITTLCVTIVPGASQLTERGASEAFRKAFNHVYNETVDALNAGMPASVTGVRLFMIETVESYIQAAYPGSSVIGAACQGTAIPTTAAKYQTDCN
ncbi:hypothetical protein [uncultured Chitinophaga sp.]|uniref:hypothetical protein n=1 Tax=uncultured Chitinophaga sp. TaxID=339340 RepID=UPI0025EF5937|nr:hypothetical protein [uncultured Chitinophaga sp.]